MTRDSGARLAPVAASVPDSGPRLGRSAARGAHGSPLLKTFAAIHGTPLSWLKWDGGFFPALRTDGFRLYALNAISRRYRSALRPRRLTGFAPLGLVLESFVGEKHLLAGSEHKLRPAVRALQDLIVIFHGPLRAWPGDDRRSESDASRHELTRPESFASVRLACDRPKGDRLYRLVLLSPLFLTKAFTRESFLGATSFSGLHEVAVLLDFLDDVFRLHFSLEAPESVLQRFALLNYNFSHA